MVVTMVVADVILVIGCLGMNHVNKSKERIVQRLKQSRVSWFLKETIRTYYLLLPGFP